MSKNHDFRTDTSIPSGIVIKNGNSKPFYIENEDAMMPWDDQGLLVMASPFKPDHWDYA